jgi:hypothetical protein
MLLSGMPAVASYSGQEWRDTLRSGEYPQILWIILWVNLPAGLIPWGWRFNEQSEPIGCISYIFFLIIWLWLLIKACTQNFSRLD